MRGLEVTWGLHCTATVPGEEHPVKEPTPKGALGTRKGGHPFQQECTGTATPETLGKGGTASPDWGHPRRPAAMLGWGQFRPTDT